MKRNALEWAILAVSIVAIVGIVGFLLVDAAADGGRPAAVGATAQMDRGVATDNGWVVPIRVHNRGGAAALSVAIEVSELTVDVLAGGSEVELLAGFSRRPDADVAIRIVGLETP